MNTEKHEEDDELWQLLGKARQPSVSPFFSRNVLRAVRNEKQERFGSFWRIFRSYRQALVLASCVAVVSVGTFFAEHQREEHQILTIAQTVSESPDYQVIAHLDELLDSEESSVWLDASLN